VSNRLSRVERALRGAFDPSSWPRTAFFCSRRTWGALCRITRRPRITGCPRPAGRRETNTYLRHERRSGRSSPRKRLFHDGTSTSLTLEPHAAQHERAMSGISAAVRSFPGARRIFALPIFAIAPRRSPCSRNRFGDGSDREPPRPRPRTGERSLSISPLKISIRSAAVAIDHPLDERPGLPGRRQHHEPRALRVGSRMKPERQARRTPSVPSAPTISFGTSYPLTDFTTFEPPRSRRRRLDEAHAEQQIAQPP